MAAMGLTLFAGCASSEPKIKFYYGVKGTSMEDAKKKSDAMGDELMAMVNQML